MRRTLNKVIGGSSKDLSENKYEEANSSHGSLSSSSTPLDVPHTGSSADAGSKSRSASSGAIYETEEPRRPSFGPTRSMPATSTMSLSLGLGRLRTPSGTGSDVVSTGAEVGLHLINDAPNRAADLILVHGLGGSWAKTWSWKHDPQIFWPQWLPTDETLSRLRIFSFGYNANFKGPSTTLGILDFAKDLLFKMSGYGEQGEKIGQIPIIFVAHSMGGLVVKKAYILGTMDDSYSDMIARVFGVIFLSTPHKGSEFAHTLNNILSASLVLSTKVYLSELETMSPTLQDINEQFRLVCKPLRLVSFYETEKTSIGGSKKLIVDRDSGILGYPSEISSSMTADHHNVSKFSSPHDPNYIALKNTIRDWTTKCIGDTPAGQSSEVHHNDEEEILSKLITTLGVQEVIELDKFQQLDGTCEWIQKRDDYQAWISPSKDAFRMLWLTGLPGTGKSTLAQSIVNRFRIQEDSPLPDCQYHFFSFADATKRKVAYALRCIAFQVALANKSFCEQLIQLHEKTGLKLEQQDTQVIWSRIFEGILFKMEFNTPLHWILDGLDEADSPVALANLLLGAKPRSPIRILLTSRPAPALLNLAASNRPFLTHSGLTERDTNDDIKLFIRTRVQDTLPIAYDMKERVTQQMFKRASGSFLWAKLALKTLEQAWHTEEDIQRALNDIPEGMQALFERMLRTIQSTKEDNPRHYLLAYRILAWAACSAEPLTTAELAVALEPEFTKLQNLEVTILHLCGLFLTTSGSKIMPIHETAKSFLLGSHRGPTAFLDGKACHEHMAKVCINYLSGETWKIVLFKIQDRDSGTKIVSQNRLKLLLSEHPFLRYAVSNWAYHVSHADPSSDELFSILQDFFDRHVLSWIHACVLLVGLRVITRSAQHIKAYGRKRKSKVFLGSNLSLSQDNIQFFQLWAIDLIRMIGRFGRNLAEKPSSIYKIIPPLCPRGSMLFKTYSPLSPLSLHGISSQTWDDCLARLPIGEERTISKVISTLTYFICLIAVSGEIVVCYSETCEEARRMHHGEYVTYMAVNKSGSLLATAGIETFRVWDLSTGEELYRLNKTGGALVMTISFGSVDTQLVVGFDDCMVVCFDMQNGTRLWDFLADEEDDQDYHPCPRAMVLSPDVTKLAIVFRGRPVLVWDFTSLEKQATKCVRESDLLKQTDDAWDQLDSIIWAPDGLSIFVLFQDTTIVRFFLTDDPAIENGETLAREMVISHDGNLLLTSDNAGTLSLWSLPETRLVYRLPHEEFVRDLAFSPDSQRFYDVRGSICNVWEPDVLLRPDEEDPEDISTSDNSDTVFSDPVVSTDASLRTQMTSITYGPYPQYFACGQDDGSVTIYDIANGKKVRKVYNHANIAAVITLNWSPTGKYMASSDDNGRVIVKRLEQKGEDGKWAVFPCLDFRDQEPANEFCFNYNEKLVLISFPASDRVWNLKTKTQIWRRDREPDLGLRWMNHPSNKNLILCFRYDKTTVHDWLPQKKQAPTVYPSAGVSPTSVTSSVVSFSTNRQLSAARVRRVAMSEVRKCIVAEVLPSAGSHTKAGGKELRLELIAPEKMNKYKAGQSIPRKDLLEGITLDVRRFLGFHKDKVVFLNHEYWICTWPLGGVFEPPKRHFFLPRDCIGPSSLPLVTLAEEGTVLFPKNGEIAVVQNGLKL